MSDAPVSGNNRIAVVLGGGGPVGIAWLAGLADGFRAAGIDLSRADRIIGTSAGAVVGAAIATGRQLSTLLTPDSSNSEPTGRDFTPLLEIAALLRTLDQDREHALARIGELAHGANTGTPDEHLHRIGSLVGFADWPDHDLVATSIDIGTGDLAAWTRHGKATLVQALAASTSVPGVFPPIEIDGSHYIDGGVRSSINADLAHGYDTVVILEPLAHLFPRTSADRSLQPATEVSVAPDEAAIAAFGTDLFADAALLPSYQAGTRQAGEAAHELTARWPTE